MSKECGPHDLGLRGGRGGEAHPKIKQFTFFLLPHGQRIAENLPEPGGRLDKDSLKPGLLHIYH